MKNMNYNKILFLLIPLASMIVLQPIVSAQDDAITTISAENVSLIILKSVNGNIKLQSWLRPEISIKALGTSRDGEQVQKELGEAEVKVERSSDRIKIELNWMFDKPLRSSIEFQVFAPENVNLDISNVNGFIDITGNKGKENLTTSNGYIYLKDVVSSITAKTVNGDIRGDLRFDGESKFNTIAGSVDLLIADEFSVPLTIETVSGSISVSIPYGYKADLDAFSGTGSVNCSFPHNGWSSEIGNRNSIRGKVFGGGPKMKLRTISGNIKVSSTATPEEKSMEIQEEKPEPLQTEVMIKIKELKTPLLEVIRTLNPPIIDGRIDEELWRRGAKIENFVGADGSRMPIEPTEAYLLWDDKNLYIGIRCYESNMDSLSARNTKNDSLYWNDDMIQIFIDSTPEMQSHYYHITVNPLGTVIDWEIARAEMRRTIETKLGIKWNIGGKVATDIRKNSWTIEAEIPFSSLNAIPKEGDIWRFNLYRVEQRLKEHTYWSPTFGPGDWPHSPDKFGQLKFINVKLSEKPAETQPVGTTGGLIISDIFIDGNNKITKEEILGVLELEPGDLADVDALSRSKARLMALGWFKNINLELAENHKGVDLIIKLEEKEIISPDNIQIKGNSIFSSDQIVRFFNLKPFRATLEDIDTKCRLIEALYNFEGYDSVKVSNNMVSNSLIIEINEGRIDRIEVIGNKKVRTQDIINSLDIKIGELYKKSFIDNAIHTLRFKIPYFQSIKWSFVRSEEGQNIIRIELVEGGRLEKDLEPEWDFNRVHGFILGVDARLENKYSGVKGYAGFSYGFSSEIWDFNFGFEKSWFMENRFTIGANIHRITDTNDWELVSDHENKIAELILGEAWRDYYQREGYELSLSQKFLRAMGLSIKYREDEYNSLPKTNDWSVFNRFYLDEDLEEVKFDDDRYRERIREEIDDKYKPENPAIDEGEMRSIITEYTIDTRNFKTNPNNGWYNTFSIEYAGQELGGSYDFNIYQMNIRRYNRLSGNQFLAFRLKAATADSKLSPYHPRKFHLGGIGTLRGYGYKEFSGDKMLLFNGEYWLMTKWPHGFGLVFFLDSGYAWPYDSDIKAEDLKTDAGIGFQIHSFRVDMATPIRDKGKDKKFMVSARLARMF